MRQVLLVLGFSLSCCFFAKSETVRINEIFPRAQNSPEWFELYNGSAAEVNVRGWHVGKNDDSSVVALTDMIIKPGGYLVCTKDIAAFSTVFPGVQNAVQLPHWYTLDNYHDTVVLWDANALPCDSVAWDSKWFSSWTTQSISRVSDAMNGMDKRSWVIAGNPSPGKQNPEKAWHGADIFTLDIGPIPFTPNGDGKDDYLSIDLALPAGATASISIYGFDGKKYYDIADALSPHILWNGNASSGAKMPCGPFFVVEEIDNNGAKSVLRKKGVLWR